MKHYYQFIIIISFRAPKLEDVEWIDSCDAISFFFHFSTNIICAKAAFRFLHRSVMDGKKIDLFMASNRASIFSSRGFSDKSDKV